MKRRFRPLRAAFVVLAGLAAAGVGARAPGGLEPGGPLVLDTHGTNFLIRSALELTFRGLGP